MDPELHELLDRLVADPVALAQALLDADAPLRELAARVHADDVAALERLNVGPNWDAPG